MSQPASTRERPQLNALNNATTFAAALIADVGHLDAIDWLEGELAQTKCPRAAAMLCNIIDAVEAQSRGRLH